MSANLLVNLRVWRDEHLEKLWRVSYNEGEGETLVSFPDTAALSDFLVERLGLGLVAEDEFSRLPTAEYFFTTDDTTELDFAN